ncbi:MAG: hypothetical protein CM1200mP2_29150 [Planctomycetaceae bacterium]|nr:MAG: hypothetical protein CM1200mP2_29150 [Planctomycetaceae bacterium]
MLAWLGPKGECWSALRPDGQDPDCRGAVYEGLANPGPRVYYTTPLIALCEQKLRELQDSAQRWGYPRESGG